MSMKEWDAKYAGPFAKNPSVRIKGVYGFAPQSWGCIGWKSKTTLERIKKETSSPFIMAVWVTKNADKNMKGKVVGFYELTHETGRRAEFIEKWQDEAHPKGKWEHSFKASRAWEILPEYRPKLQDFFPELCENNRQRAAASWSEGLPVEIAEKLKALPRKEVKVYGVSREIDPDIIIPNVENKKGYVGGGASRRGGYSVGEPKDTEKELYILHLKGDIDNFLGYSADGKKIIKVGLALSPETRRAIFQKALPKGAYHWEVLRTTRLDGFAMYPDRVTAEYGEMAMKKFLGEDIAKHLGGEFYLADDERIEQAWKLGREVSLKKMKENDG